MPRQEIGGANRVAERRFDPPEAACRERRLLHSTPPVIRLMDSRPPHVHIQRFVWVRQGRPTRRSPGRNWIPVTSNLPVDEWSGLLRRERPIGALLDRATHPVTSSETNGDSYRRNACAIPMGHRVLAIDDDAVVRETLRRALEAAGFDVETSAWGQVRTFGRPAQMVCSWR